METSITLVANNGTSNIEATQKIQRTQLFLQRNKQAFLQKYDKVISQHILGIFHRAPEEYDRAHDHRVTKVIKGELVNLRLDTLNGEADGIKVSSHTSQKQALYIWFQPDFAKEKITFKTVCGLKRKKIQVDLQKIGSDFLMHLIYKLFIRQLPAIQS